MHDDRDGVAGGARAALAPEAADAPTSVHRRLSDALAQGRFALVAQPIVDLATDQVTAHEVLLRLHDGIEPAVAPRTFLPVAERTGLAAGIDQWVLGRAVAALATPAARRRHLCLQVNVTGASLADLGFASALLARLDAAGVAAERLGLEVTEATALDDHELVAALVDRLGAAGCPVVLDDFGTGVGALASLRHVPFAAVKLAGPLVRHADTDVGARTVLDGLVRVAQGLRLHVIAEEVDSRGLIQAVRDAGARGAQGYALGHPEPLDRLLTD